MATPAHMWIKDEHGTPLQSNCHVAGREGSIILLHFEHSISIPNDRDTGMLTGTRKHDPVIFTKALCPLSPLLNKACCSGKAFKEVLIRWYQIDETGNEKEYFRHTLTNVRVVAVKPLLHHVKDPLKDRSVHEEQVSLRYEKIRWEYLDGNIAAEDEWNKKTG